MHESLKYRILKYLRAWYAIDPNKYIHKGEILRLATEAGYENENAGRRLRELENEGKVDVEYVKGRASKEAVYRYSPTYDLVFQNGFVEKEYATYS